MSFLLLKNKQFLEHASPSPHPENPGRLAAIEAGLLKHPSPKLEIQSPQRRATEKELLLAHTPRWIETLRATREQEFTQLDPDTYAIQSSYDIACLAAGTLIHAVDEVQKNSVVRRAFALVRPPGHHAESDRPMGFCLFNNVAIAAHYALQKYPLERVAIYDFDLHHGNGTQQIFYERPDVLYLSHHEFPFYPGTGDFCEIGKNEGTGFTLNAPLRAGTGDKEVLFLWDQVFESVLRQFSPSILFLSAGFDAHTRDPLGHMEMTGEGFTQLFARIEMLACDLEIPLIYTLEGGYDGHALSYGVRAAIRAHTNPENILPIAHPTAQAKECVTNVKKAIQPYWKNF